VVGPLSASAPTPAPARARFATATVFLVIGGVFGNWVSRVPSVKDQVHAGSGSLGLALLGIAVGAVLARPVYGRLVWRYGSGPVTPIAAGCCCLALVLPALAANAVVLGLALVAMGAALGSVDIAMNAHAVALELAYARPIMSSFHGVYSIGGLLGALAGGRAAALGLSPLGHFALAALVLATSVALVSPWLGSAAPETTEAPDATATKEAAATTATAADATDARPASARPRRRPALPSGSRFPLVLLGVVGLCSMAGEGAVGDWGAVYLHEDLGSSVGVASSGFAVYCLAMVSGRLLGDRWVARWGDWPVITWAATAAGLGFAVALAVGNPIAALCGFAVLGLGLSLVVPVTMSRAGRLGGESAGSGVAVASSISGLGPIVVPPVIGFLAEAAGLPVALGAVSGLALFAVVLIRLVQRLTSGAAAPVSAVPQVPPVPPVPPVAAVDV